MVMHEHTLGTKIGVAKSMQCCDTAAGVARGFNRIFPAAPLSLFAGQLKAASRPLLGASCVNTAPSYISAANQFFRTKSKYFQASLAASNYELLHSVRSPTSKVCG